jgi:DNA-nicking Smr family endonuclease
MITMEQKQKNTGIIELDIHGMTKYQAKLLIDSQLKKAKQNVYRIRVIHGFHSGTELKDMLQDDYAKHPKVIRIEGSLNQGITELVLRELY